MVGASSREFEACFPRWGRAGCGDCGRRPGGPLPPAAAIRGGDLHSRSWAGSGSIIMTACAPSCPPGCAWRCCSSPLAPPPPLPISPPPPPPSTTTTPPHPQCTQFKALLFLEELASILLTPLLLWFSLPQCAGGCGALGGQGPDAGAFAGVHTGRAHQTEQYPTHPRTHTHQHRHQHCVSICSSAHHTLVHSAPLHRRPQGLCSPLLSATPPTSRAWATCAAWRPLTSRRAYFVYYI